MHIRCSSGCVFGKPVHRVFCLPCLRFNTRLGSWISTNASTLVKHSSTRVGCKLVHHTTRSVCRYKLAIAMFCFTGHRLIIYSIDQSLHSHPTTRHHHTFDDGSTAGFRCLDEPVPDSRYHDAKSQTNKANSIATSPASSSPVTSSRSRSSSHCTRHCTSKRNNQV